MKTKLKSPVAVTLTVALIALAAWVAGCSSDEPVAVDQTLSTQSTTSATTPTITDIQSAVTLNAEQVAVVETALQRWRTQTTAQNAEAFAFGPGGPHGALQQFIADVAPALDNQQLSAMSQFVAQYRKQQMEARMNQFANGDRTRSGHHGRTGFRGRGGSHGPGGGLLGLIAELGLSDEQVAALKTAFQAMREDMRALRDQFMNGEITEEEFRAQADALREQMQATAQEILSEDQWAAWQALKLERMIARIEARLENADERIATRVEHLTAIVELTEEQQATITGILQDAIPQVEAVLAGLKDGTISTDEAREQLHQIRSDTRDAVLAELTQEQLERLEACHPVFPRRGQ